VSNPARMAQGQAICLICGRPGEQSNMQNLPGLGWVCDKGFPNCKTDLPDKVRSERLRVVTREQIPRRMVAMLHKLEWSKWRLGLPTCPVCKGRRHHHQDGCALGILINDIERVFPERRDTERD
jgi:hypothetical protein